MKNFTSDELQAIETIRELVGIQLEECECLEVYDEILERCVDYF